MQLFCCTSVESHLRTEGTGTDIALNVSLSAQFGSAPDHNTLDMVMVVLIEYKRRLQQVDVEYGGGTWRQSISCPQYYVNYEMYLIYYYYLI